MKNPSIILKNVRVHNLQSVDLTLSSNRLIVFTGVSGSGKSSMAFDTIYTEGQRRYVESLSAYARRQLGDMAKPDLEHASGLSPTISIEQKTAGRNPRSTVGTLTEIYDYLRVLYARVGLPHCPISGEVVRPQSKEQIIHSIQQMKEGSKLMILAPFARQKKAEFREDFQELQRKGYLRVRIDGSLEELGEDLALDGSLAHDVDVVVDRLIVRPQDSSRIAESVLQALELSEGECMVFDATTEEEHYFSMHAFSPKSGRSYHNLEPHDFSFNSPSGMCSRCQGLGETTEFDLDKIIDPTKSIAEDCCSIASSYQTVRYGNIYDNLARLYKFDIHTPWSQLSKSAQKVFLHGTQKKWTRMIFVHPKKGSTWTDSVQWRGVLYEAHERYAQAKSDSYRRKMEKLMTQQCCPDCKGTRLKPYPAATTLGGKKIHELTALTVDDCASFFDSLSLPEKDQLIAEELLKEIRERLRFLLDVGLHYLTLHRTSPTLSGGEAQRVRLASQIGCGLVGVTYILDEPSIGLHPRDNKRLIQTLQSLRDLGNTVIVVEHDEETMWAADHVVDFGPGAGSRGGEIVVSGSVRQLLRSKRSMTGQYLSGKRHIAWPEKRRKPSKKKLEVRGATHHNLKNLTVKFPLECFVAVTGVSGSGKSSLVSDVLHPALMNLYHKGEQTVGAHKDIKGTEHIDKVICIDQTPIGRNPRSNPATYIKLFDEIRDLFSRLPESQARGYGPGRFSFNVKEGSCPRCGGMGMTKVDMDFMEDVWVPCSLCHGRRFDHETLTVLYKGRNIYDVLEMEVQEALDFFSAIPSIHHKLETLAQVGLEYLRLGQASTTLSGGEAQRIKLARELVRPASGRTLYLLDEPTTGLHFHDISHLLHVLHSLVDRGNSVVVIEHNMDVVKTADWILDLGPDGGEGGGRLLAEGTPEKLVKTEGPTGRALLELLQRDEKRQALNPAPLEPPREIQQITHITLKEAQQNNLKGLDLQIPRGKLTICTGLSGSGKSSLAFDTIYAEGQRRYIESLSPYARQFVKQMPKPKVGQVEGLSPAVAIEQKSHAGNPRSTVGTMTEIYDYLRVLYARMGTPHCPETGEVIQAISKDHVVDRILSYPQGSKLHLLAPIAVKKSEEFQDLLNRWRRQGYVRIRLNGTYYELEEEIPFTRKRKQELFLVVDRLKVTPSAQQRLLEAVENAAFLGENCVVVARDEEDVVFNLSFSVESTGKSYPEITPHSFSFNSPEGMCPDCQGLGYQYGVNLLQYKEFEGIRVLHLFALLWGPRARNALMEFSSFLKEESIDLSASLHKLSSKQLRTLFSGSPEGKTYTTQSGIPFRWPGINTVLERAGRSARTQVREALLSYLDEVECPHCRGTRLNPLARHVRIGKTDLGGLCQMPIQESLDFLNQLSLPEQEQLVLGEVHKQLVSRLQFLNDVGLHYIALDRRAPTLSGGEAQRIRLARQLGSSLTGVLYVLDEPTIGLHPRDTYRLHGVLDQLKKLGNTLIMVEHDPMTIEKADCVLDFGPQAGALGGEIMAQGTPKQVQKNSKSLTGRYLSGKESIHRPKPRPYQKKTLKIRNAHQHNLKHLNLDIPLSRLTCITGVSGSGKSTLMHNVIVPATERISEGKKIRIEETTIEGLGEFQAVRVMDQQPLGQTRRANVATYSDTMTPLRFFYASLPDAVTRGLESRHFSFNHRRGMCTGCWGMGYRKIEMHFLPPVRVQCDDCKGMRLNPLSLQVKYKELSLGQVLQLTVDEAIVHFQAIPPVLRPLNALVEVGLGYLKLGQEISSLSGGEAQRMKLSKELGKRSSGQTLFLLDEPTTGLHSEDVKVLLKVLQKLVDKGNTMILIEHNLDVIKCADYIIDLGPEAGEEGGQLLCAGTPEEIAKHKKSHTGRFLKDVLV